MIARNTARELDGIHLAGHKIRHPDVAEEPGVHFGGDPDARLGNRRQHGNLQRGQFCSVAAFELFEPGSVGDDLGTKPQEGLERIAHIVG